jgi:oligopeptide transport system substrate-binding protein
MAYLVRHFTVLLLLALCASAPADRRITFNLSGEPKTIDPHLATGVLDAYVINELIEGLTTLDEKGLPQPAMAERWDVSPDGKTYTFHLRQAKWTNGEPVTAADFVFGWRRSLAPETASEYAYQVFLVEGAEEYNSGKTKDPATVGVRAIAPDTLEVKLKNPTPYFLSLLAHIAYAPAPEKVVRANPRWASDPATYVGNGPFTLAEWRHNDRIVLKKNPAYYAADSVKLDGIDMTMIANESTALLQWEGGKVDILETYVPLPDVPRLKKEGKLQVAPYLGTYYVAVQNAQKPFNDVRVRKAFALALNRRQITESILRQGQPPALALVPPGITLQDGKDYRKSGGDLFKEDIAEAKRLLAEAGYPNGRGFPRVKYLFNDIQQHRTIGEALQQMWQQNLGVKVDLQVQEYKVYLQNLHAENYQLARAGWIGDFLDPVAFLDMYVTGAGNNDFKYSSAEFDKLVADSRATTDTVARMELLRKAEKKAIGDDMAVIPLFFYIDPFLQKPNIKGVVRNPLGYVYLKGATID